MADPIIDPLADLTIITSSLRTPWEPWSQACLARALPASPRIVVEGRFNWDPLYFVDVAAKVETRYFALVDEDCFVFDAGLIRDTVRSMEASGVEVTGPPDGGTFHRHLNPIACNTYFMVARTDVAREVQAMTAWRDLQFSDLDSAIVPAQHVVDLQLDQKRIDYSLDEPYYPFFWAALKLGKKIQYFAESVHPQLLASIVAEPARSSGESRGVIHMWWLRSSRSGAIEPYLGVSHHSRYQALLEHYLRPAFASLDMKRLLLAERLKSQARRVLGSPRWRRWL